MGVHGGRPGIAILMNGKHYFAPTESMTGRQIKDLAGIPDGNRLFLEEPGSQPDTAIPDDKVVSIKAGQHFYDLPPGVVGGLPPTVEAQINRVKESYSDVSVMAQADGSTHVTVPSVPTGPGWSSPETPLLVVLPAGYPEAARPTFYVDAKLKQAGNQPRGSSINNIAGQPWMTFCWQPTATLDQMGVDGLWRFVKFAVTRFFEV